MHVLQKKTKIRDPGKYKLEWKRKTLARIRETGIEFKDEDIRSCYCSSVENLILCFVAAKVKM